MYLVDTSVWIATLRKEQTSAVEYFKYLNDRKISFGITSIIYQEILQGVHSEKEFAKLAEVLETQRFYYPQDPVESYKKSAHLYLKCRKQGITMRSTIACLIGQIAIEHHLILLHQDKDFVQLQKVASALQLAEHH